MTVTEVKITPDLAVAKVYLSVFPSEGKEKILAEIKEKAPLYRMRLAKTAAKTMRITPELLFYVDSTLDAQEKIDRALKGEGDNPVL